MTDDDMEQLVPTGPACECCGSALRSFPFEAAEQVLLRARADKTFRGELLIYSQIRAGKRRRDFRGSLVQLKQSSTIECSEEVWAVRISDLLAVHVINVDDLSNSVKSRITKVAQADGSLVEAILYSEELPIPANLRPIRCRIINTVSTEMITAHMNLDEHVRKDQELQVYESVRGQVINSRGSCLTQRSLAETWSTAQWDQEFADIAAARKEKTLRRARQLAKNMQIHQSRQTSNPIAKRSQRPLQPPRNSLG